MGMWKIREGYENESRYPEIREAMSSNMRSNYKDSLDDYECGYEDGYRDAMKEAKKYYGERRGM